MPPLHSPKVGAIVPSVSIKASSGILPAGHTIIFVQQSSLHGILEEDGKSAAVGTGFWRLKLTEDVPDPGSTLTLLGIALGGLGFIRRRI